MEYKTESGLTNACTAMQSVVTIALSLLPNPSMEFTSRFRPRPIIGIALVLLIHALLLAALHSRIKLPDNLRNVVSIVWMIPAAPEPPKPQPLKSSHSAPPLVRSKSSAIPIHPPQTEAITASEVPPPTAPDSLPSATPHFDLDTMRAQAVQQEISRKKSPVELMNEANLKNKSLEAQVEVGANQAQRPDCRTAHAGAGLFAPIMIAADLVRDKGCKF